MNFYDDVYRESLHDYHAERPCDERRPTRAEAREDERQGYDREPSPAVMAAVDAALAQHESAMVRRTGR